jgi:hypothetical protein
MFKELSTKCWEHARGCQNVEHKLLHQEYEPFEL